MTIKESLSSSEGLEGEPHKGDLQPGHIVGTPDAEDKGEQHQEIGGRQMEPPQIRHGLVVDAGDHHHGTAAQAGSDDLYHNPAGLYIARIPDAGEQQDTEGGRKQTQPPDDLIGEFIIADDAAPDFFLVSSTPVQKPGTGFSLSFYYKPRIFPAQAGPGRIHSLDTADGRCFLSCMGAAFVI